MRLRTPPRRPGGVENISPRGPRLVDYQRRAPSVLVLALLIVGVVSANRGSSGLGGGSGLGTPRASAASRGSAASEPGDSSSSAAASVDSIGFEPPSSSFVAVATPAPTANPTPVPTPRPTNPTPVPTPRPTQVPLPPINGTFAWGMWAGQPWNSSSIKSAISMVGHSPAILMTYQHWDRMAQYLAADAKVIKGFGTSWMVTWEPDDSLQGIEQGKDDAFITGWAKAAAAWGGTIYLRYMHEMNGDWYPWAVYNGHNGNTPSDFVNAWQHTHDLFVAAGARNVKWVWSPNVRYGSNYPFANLYPGSAYVDWVALDGYNWGGQVGGHPGWQSMASIFLDSYNQVVGYGKPIVLAETASAEGGGDKAAWVRNSYFTDIPQKMSRIRAVIWFDQVAETDFRINSSTASLAAFQQIAASKAWNGRIP